jgi:hypothetical protein
MRSRACAWRRARAPLLLPCVAQKCCMIRPPQWMAQGSKMRWPICSVLRLRRVCQHRIRRHRKPCSIHRMQGSNHWRRLIFDFIFSIMIIRFDFDVGETKALAACRRHFGARRIALFLHCCTYRCCSTSDSLHVRIHCRGRGCRNRPG